MNAIITVSPEPEIIPPGTGVRLVMAMHPLKTGVQVEEAPAGLTIEELVLIAKRRSSTGLKTRVLVWLEGHEMVPEYWRQVRPHPGTSLFIRAVAAGGGDNSLVRTLLTVATAAAGLIVGIFNPTLGAAITIGGQLLVNALFPVTPPKLSSNDASSSNGTSSTYSLSGASNTLDPWGVVPSNLGKNRVYPKLGAKTYTEFVGDDQYFRMLVVWGYGPLDISSLKIGETPIENFSDVQIETRQGYNTDAPLTLFPRDVSQEDLSIDLTAAAGWQQRTSALGVTHLALDVVASSGIVRVDSQGASQVYTVSLRAEYSPTGSGTWVLLQEINLTARSTDTIRRTLEADVAAGQYDVRIKKTSGDYTASDHVSEGVVWTALRGFTNDEPIAFPKPLAKTALRIRATSQLNGVLSTLNGIVQSIVTSWSGAAWVPNVISNNPASLFRHVLQGPANARPVSDGKLGLERLQDWADYCATNGFTFDMYRDFTSSVLDVLNDIATAGRGAVVFIDGQWSIAWDDPSAEIVQHLTPRNGWAFSGKITYRDLPHALRVRFVNEQIGYQQDERIVYDDGYNADGSGGLTIATRFEEIEFPGQTNPNNVWRHGRFHIAQARLRPEIMTITVDIEHIAVTRGDRVRVNYDVPLLGGGAGRVKAIAGNVVTIDEPVTMVAATNYVIRFRRSNGVSVVCAVVTDDGQQTVLTLTDPPTGVQVGDLWMFGETENESIVMRVRSVTPAPDLSARISLVADAPEISAADTGVIPAFVSHVSLPFNAFTAPPINLRVRETLEGVNGDVTSGAALTWDVVVGEYPIAFETQYQDVDGDAVWKAGHTVLAPTKSDQIGKLGVGHWKFRVRCLFANGDPSGWTEDSQTFTGLAGVELGDIENLRMVYADKIAALEWDSVQSAWPVMYEVRKGESWETGLTVGEPAQPRHPVGGAGTYWVAAKIQPAPGILKYSDNPASNVIAGAVLVDNVVADHDEAGEGWTGTISDPLKGAIEGSNFVTLVANEVVYYEIPTAHVVNINYARPTKLNADWEVTGVPVASDFLGDPDFLNNPDFLSSASSRLVKAWVEIAITEVGDNDAFGPSDIFSESDAFLAGSSFGPWIKLSPGVYKLRSVKFRLAIMSLDASVKAAAIKFTTSVDVPDRIDNVLDFALAAGGHTFVFRPDGETADVPFNGGPGTATVPRIIVNVVGGNDADTVLITRPVSAPDKLAQVTIQVVNGGVGVARTINAFFQGW